MRRLVTGSMVLSLSLLVMVGCSSFTPGEPAPPGYHYELVDTGKQRKEQVTVADVDPAQAHKAKTMVVRTNSDVAGPGDYWIYVTEGKQSSRVLVHDEALKSSPGAWLIHIGPDQLCPQCKVTYLMVGHQMQRQYYCYSNVHVAPPTPKQID